MIMRRYLAICALLLSLTPTDGFRSQLPIQGRWTKIAHSVQGMLDKHQRPRRRNFLFQASSRTITQSPRTQTIREHEDVPTTLRNAFQIFFLDEYNGPRACAALIATMTAWRASLDVPLSVNDAAVGASMVVFWWVQEHWMHLHLLHSKQDWYGKEVHQTHHDKPYYHISIDPAPLMVGWLLAVHCMTRAFLPLPMALSATVGYASAGLFYEWAHFIAHTRVPFRKNSYWKKKKDHHVRHHLVDEENWLGFSLPAIDTLFGTNPDALELKRRKMQQ